MKLFFRLLVVIAFSVQTWFLYYFAWLYRAAHDPKENISSALDRIDKSEDQMTEDFMKVPEAFLRTHQIMDFVSVTLPPRVLQNDKKATFLIPVKYLPREGNESVVLICTVVGYRKKAEW